MAYKDMPARHQRLAKSRLSNQDERDMIDAIREMMGMRPLYKDEQTRNYGYKSGAMPIHQDIAPIRITVG